MVLVIQMNCTCSISQQVCSCMYDVSPWHTKEVGGAD